MLRMNFEMMPYILEQMDYVEEGMAVLGCVKLIYVPICPLWS